MDGEASQKLAGSNAWINPSWIRTDSLVSFSFTALGTPKPKGRPRTVRNRHTGFVQTYTPDATVSWEQAIGWQAKQALAWVEVNHPGEVAECLPFTDRILANIRFNLKRPKSAPKRVKYPMSGGDVDNLAKSVLDALQNVQVIGDDKTVTDTIVIKRFADDDHPEGVEVELTAWIAEP
jgi:Holliday junction resolvase RusA-like endonuclease